MILSIDLDFEVGRFELDWKGKLWSTCTARQLEWEAPTPCMRRHQVRWDKKARLAKRWKHYRLLKGMLHFFLYIERHVIKTITEQSNNQRHGRVWKEKKTLKKIRFQQDTQASSSLDHVNMYHDASSSYSWPRSLIQKKTNQLAPKVCIYETKRERDRGIQSIIII